MAGNEAAAQQGQETLNAGEQMDKFAGFATRDGEVLKPEGQAPAAPKDAKQQTPRDTAGKFQKKDAAGSGGANEGADDDKPNDGKHNSRDKRINQAVGRQRAAERRAEAAEARYRELEARMAQGGLTTQTQQATPPKAPNPKDYEGGEYDARYLADVAKHEARVAVSEAASKAQQDTTKAAQAERQQIRSAELQRQRDDFFSEASETYDDFEEVVGDPTNPLSPAVGLLAMESDFGAQILYELAGDRKEARRVFGLSPEKQAAWFGRREAALEQSSEAPDADGANDGDGDDGDTPTPQSGSRKSKAPQAPPVPEFNTRGRGEVPKVSASTTDFAAFERMAAGSKK